MLRCGGGRSKLSWVKYCLAFTSLHVGVVLMLVMMSSSLKHAVDSIVELSEQKLSIVAVTCIYCILSVTSVATVVVLGWYALWRLILSHKKNVREIVNEMLGWNEEEKRERKSMRKKERERRRPSLVRTSE